MWRPTRWCKRRLKNNVQGNPAAPHKWRHNFDKFYNNVVESVLFVPLSAVQVLSVLGK